MDYESAISHRLSVLSDSDNGRVKYKANFLNYQEGVRQLIDNMKMNDEKNSTRNLDHRRMNIAHNIEYLDCETDVQKTIQNEKRAVLDMKLEKNDTHLANLLNRAQELLNNVSVENECWFFQRHKSDKQHRLDLEEKVRSSALLAAAEYEEIMSRFTELEELPDTLKLNEQLNQQKDKILKLMEQKDALIEQCKNSVKCINDVYFESFEAQNLKIILLIERINAAVDVANQAYGQAVDDFEEKLQVESGNLQQMLQYKTQSNLQKTQEFIEERKDELMNKFTNYMEQLNVIQHQQEDITRVISIQLEMESDALLRKMIQERSSILVNSEKLDYNLQIVQNRNVETLTLINQHKRKAARSVTQTNKLLKKREILSKKIQQECAKMSKDTMKLKQLIEDMHEKSKRLRVANKRNFDSIWRLNYQEVLQSTKQILSIDRMLSEFLCNIEYQPPNIDLRNINEGHAKVNKLKLKSGSGKLHNSFENHMLRGLMRVVLKQISDRGGMLLESTLMEILQQYGESNERLVRVENIFKALHISNVKLLEKLNEHFRNYAWCPNCANGLPDQVIQQLLCKLTSDSKCEESKLSGIEQGFCDNHYLVTEQAFVFTILNDFLKKLCLNVTQKSLVEEIYTAQPNLIKLDKDKISGFFFNLLNYFNDAKLKHWKIMEHALAHYMLTLRKRVKLHEEVEELKKQNSQLKYFKSGLTREYA